MGRAKSEIDVVAYSNSVAKMGVSAIAIEAGKVGDTQSEGATMIKVAMLFTRFGILKASDPKVAKMDSTKEVWDNFAATHYGENRTDKRRREAPKGDKRTKAAAKYKHFEACGAMKAWGDNRLSIAREVIGAYELNPLGLSVKAALLNTLMQDNTAKAPPLKVVQEAITARAKKRTTSEYNCRAGMKRVASTVASWFATEKDAKAFWTSFIETDDDDKANLTPRAKALAVTLIQTAMELGLAVSNSPELKKARETVLASLAANGKLYSKELKANSLHA
jgi:hypothetical protein